MKKQYFVMYRRDVETEKHDGRAKGREVYDDRSRDFSKIEEACRFFLDNLARQPILLQRPPYTTKDAELAKYPGKPYVVTGFFEAKYWHESYGGDNHTIPTNEAIRCEESGLEKAVADLAAEGAVKISISMEINTTGLLLKYSGLYKRD